MNEIWFRIKTETKASIRRSNKLFAGYKTKPNHEETLHKYRRI